MNFPISAIVVPAVERLEYRRSIMRTLLAAVGVVALAVGSWTLSGLSSQADEKEKTVKDDIDITSQAKELNSDKFAAPPTKFRPGHVTVRQLDPKAIVADKDGFRIQLPSKAPIPTPTVQGGRLFASGGFRSKEFYCFDAVSGKLVWAVDLDDDGPTSAVIEDDVVVFNTESCTIFALDASTGKHLWSHFLGDPLTSTPTIAGGMVFTSYPANGGGGGENEVNQDPLSNQKPAPGKAAPQAKQRPSASHVLACFELKTGKILWQRWIDSDVMSAPVASGSDLYCTSFGGTVYKFAQASGDIVSAQKSRATSAPVVVGDNVYLTKRAEKPGTDEPASESVAGYDRQKSQPRFEENKRVASYLDGKVQSQSKLKDESKDLDAGNGFGGGVAPVAANAKAGEQNIGQGNVSSLQAFQGSRILNFADRNYNCMGDEVICSDPADGKKLWSAKLTGDLKKEGGHLAAPPAAAGGRIFLSTLEGNVVQMDPAKGAIEKSYKIGSPLRSQPAIVDGRLYVGTQDGRIVCVDTGNRAFTGWSTWGANSRHTNVVDGR
jgi:Ca-activated chloride channel homolog